jgi:glutaredoxin
VPSRTLTFVTRSACPLCDEAEALLERWSVRLGFDVETADVEADPTLESDYGTRVPVLLGPSGSVIAEGRWSQPRLVAALLRERYPGGARRG